MLINVYFEEFKGIIAITFRYFDQLLHENLMYNVNGQWFCK